MRQSGKGSGGGIGMNKNVRPGANQGNRARAIHEKGVSQIGSNLGNHVMGKGGRLHGAVEPVRGQRLPSGGPGGVMLGNENARSAGAGPGAGRTIHNSGGQGQHGPVDRGMPGLPSTRGQWPD